MSEKKYIATEETLDDVKDLVSDIKDMLDAGAGGVPPHITVNALTGSTVTITCGAKTLTPTESYGVWEADIPFLGVWTVNATKSGTTKSMSVNVAEVKRYIVNIPYTAIYGVCYNYGGTSTELTRLTTATDPNNLVNVTITTDPAPAIGGGAGSSPFDDRMPWAGMEEYNIVSGAVGPKKGEDGFSRSTKDTCVLIPEFYIRVIDDNANSKRYFYLADGPVTNFTKHPFSNKFIGRYETADSSGYVSRSGLSPKVNMTRATARTNSASKGTGWRLQDFAARSAITWLYLIEFADWNAQEKIGAGWSDSSNTAAIKTGGTDIMSYHTGRPSGVDGKTAVQYRWIENPWGNIWEFVDGFNANDRKAYVCTDPTKYADDTSTDYTDTGVTMPTSSGSYIANVAYISALPWAFVPSAVGGSATQKIPDGLWTNTGWRILVVSGSWGNGSLCGVLAFGSGDASSHTDAGVGARLLFDP